MKEQWIISAIINDDFHKEYVESPEQAYETIFNYVRAYMLSNDERTAEKKAVYVRDLVNGVNKSIESYIEWKNNNPLY